MNEDDLSLGVDGCSAPIFGMPLYNQALAYKNLVAPMPWKDEALDSVCKRIVHAVTQYPELIGGTKRYCSDLMRVTKGRIVGKTGADGVYCLSILEKNWGIAIKVDDGKMGPQYNIAQAVIEQLHVLSDDANSLLRNYVEQENKNFGGMLTGETLVSANVKVVLKTQ